MRFHLPLPPNRANGRGHWAAIHRDKKAYWAACDLLWATGELPKRPRTPLAKATITAAFRVWRRNDEDNLMARAKWPIDWLTTRGYIADDSPDVLTWTGKPTQECVPRAETGLSITLEPV